MAGNSDAVPFGEGSSVVADGSRATSFEAPEGDTDLDGVTPGKVGDGEGEPEETPEAKADGEPDGTDGDKKHEKHVPYERFQEVNEKLKAASQHELKAKAFDDLMTTKAGREIISKIVAGTYSEDDGQEPEIPSLEGLNFAEMDDVAIGEALAGHTTAKVMSSLQKELAPIKQFMQQMQQKLGQTERESLFADKGKEYPLASENREQIESFLDKGLDFDAAYWAACGKTAAQKQFEDGRAKKEEKKARETHVAPRGKPGSGQQRTGRPYKSVQAAWNESKQELGL